MAVEDGSSQPPWVRTFFGPTQGWRNVPESEIITGNSFLNLEDTPDTYVGKALSRLRVNAGATGLEFEDAPAASSNLIVYLSEFLTGSGDQTANINAAFATLAGKSGTLVWDVNPRIVTTDTIVVGHNGFPNNSGPTSFISIVGVSGGDACGISYNGPTDRPALLFCKNKFFTMRNLDLGNVTGVRGTSVGVGFGGQGPPNNSGTMTLAYMIENVRVIGFDVGFQAGINFGDSSEGIFIGCVMYNCNTGWTAIGFNCLDFSFHMISMSDCGVGLNTGASDGYHVYGGSSTNSSICDFFIDSNSQHSSITGWRLETSINKPMVSGNGGNVTLRNCRVFNSVGEGPVVGPVAGFPGVGGITIENSILNGWVVLGTNGFFVTMRSTVARADPNTGFPFFMNTDGAFTKYFGVLVEGCGDYAGVVAVPDFRGSIRTENLDSGAPFTVDLVEPLVYRPGDISVPANTGTQFGAAWQALSRVRSLAEGPVGAMNTPPSNTAINASANGTAGGVITFASVPSTVVPGQMVEDLMNGGAFGFTHTVVTERTPTTITVNHNATAVLTGHTIKFYDLHARPMTGKNLRVTGTFVSSGTLNFLFKRTMIINGTGSQTHLINAGTGRFYPTDVGKAIRIVGGGNQGWTDAYGNIVKYVSSTQVQVEPGMNQVPWVTPNGSTGFVGEDEPDADYIVSGLCGDVGETFWVTNLTATGFTLHSSNAGSTANVVAMIVR